MRVVVHTHCRRITVAFMVIVIIVIAIMTTTANDHVNITTSMTAPPPPIIPTTTTTDHAVTQSCSWQRCCVNSHTDWLDIFPTADIVLPTPLSSGDVILVLSLFVVIAVAVGRGAR